MGGEHLTDFERIYEQYFKDVYSFIFTLCQNESIAEEITQETFFKALKSIDSYKGTCKMNVWLCQIAKNTYFTYHTKQKRIITDQGIERVSKDNIEETLVRKDDAFTIHRALHQLQEPYKEVFTLRIFGELSFNEISQLFEKSESWARVTFYRAKQKIQLILVEEL